MKRRLTCMGTALSLSVGLVGNVKADQLSDLQAQVKALTESINALQKRQEQYDAKQSVVENKQSVVESKPAVVPANVVTSGVMPNSILITGTNTSLKIGGYAQVSVIDDFKGSLGNSQTVLLPYSPTYGGIPYNGTAAANRNGQIQFEARESRLNFETRTPTAYGELRTLVEGDFYGAGGSKATTNSVSLRLRLAMAEIGPWLAGQYWSNFGDLYQGPEVFDFGGPVGLPAINRQPQIRYTQKIGKNWQLSASIEQPVQDFVGADTVLFTAGLNNISTNSVDELPELTGRLTYGDTWGRQSVGAVVRKLKASDGAALDSSLTGYALNYQGQFNTFGKDKVYYDLVYENGAGRYLTQTPSSAALYKGQLYAISGRGANLTYQHWWAENWRSNISAGLIKLSNPHPATPLTQFDEVRSLHANILWSPIPKALVGLEYTYAKIKNEASQEGSGQRLNLTTQFGF